MEGTGVLVFENGNEYAGEFLDGQFHGRGVMHLAQGGTYAAVWDKGRIVEGTMMFARTPLQCASVSV